MKRWIGVAVVATALFLSGCAEDGGQANPNEPTGETDTVHTGVEGVDKQIIETFDINVEVQKITVGGIDCVLATRDDTADFTISCP